MFAFWATNYIAFDGTVVTKLASEFFAPAEEKGGAVHLIGHRVLGISLLFTGDIVQSRTHFNQALALYDPAKHRPLAMRFGHDNRVAVYTMRSLALWILGFPDAALADAHQALKDARDIGQAATLMYALSVTLFATFLCGRYTTVEMQSHEVASVADDNVRTRPQRGLAGVFSVLHLVRRVVLFDRIAGLHRTGGLFIPPCRQRG